MTAKNWPSQVDYGHPNFTGKTPRVSKYDGVGAWAKDSTRIPPVAVVYTVVVVALAYAVLHIGAAVGFF